jgi:hypothetical protein
MIKAGDKYLVDKKTGDARRPTAPVLMSVAWVCCLRHLVIHLTPPLPLARHE